MKDLVGTHRIAAEALEKLSGREILEELLIQMGIDVLAADGGVIFRKRSGKKGLDLRTIHPRDLRFPKVVEIVVLFIGARRDLSNFPIKLDLEISVEDRGKIGRGEPVTGDAKYAADLLSMLRDVLRDA